MKRIHLLILMISSLAILAAACTQKTKYYLAEVDKQMAPYQRGDTVYVMDGWGKKVMLTVKDIKKYWRTYGYHDYLREQYQTVYVQSEQGDFGYTIDIDLSGGSVHEYGMVTVRDLSFHAWGGFEYDAGKTL